ncbi:hypothetical protein [Bacillus sp. B15-48]|uniref:hypothetical protein n=1 Tax=Bacillus sp. B15-48 TaxID=1548601 RepID=UPI00193FC726|nr:hypothetical protein [Bacillus sp. B15-48]MBM4763284.1 hypothetical protein [Bacillus sp. B15-48]
MSQTKKGKVLHVDKLTIHAKEVDFIHERKEEIEKPREVRDPWGFLWGRSRIQPEMDTLPADEESEVEKGENE